MLSMGVILSILRLGPSLYGSKTSLPRESVSPVQICQGCRLPGKHRCAGRVKVAVLFWSEKGGGGRWSRRKKRCPCKKCNK